ncbi:transposable element Tcb1 transposase [Trichonephila clavipes]|nr:transposable element Tcb1 transposase [Trichonephila clavipes]
MYGSTCADMQVDVMGECLSSIKHVVGTTSRCFYPRSNHSEVGGRPQCDKCGCRVRIAHSIVSRLWRQFQTTGTAIRGSVVVVHEEPHPQMTGTLSNRPEETGSRQREKSLDTRHRRLDDRYRVLPWPEDCTVVVCLHDALYGVPLTPAHRRRRSLWCREHRN